MLDIMTLISVVKRVNLDIVTCGVINMAVFVQTYFKPFKCSNIMFKCLEGYFTHFETSFSFYIKSRILSYNDIKCMQPDSLAGLRQLKLLNLYSNDLSTIPFNSFKDLTSLVNM